LFAVNPDYRLDEALLGQVLAILDACQDPYLGKGLVGASCVKALALSGLRLQLTLEFPYPCQSRYRELEQKLAGELTRLDAIDGLDCHFSFQTRANPAQSQIASLAKVKHVIAVASGKGGVGKSTTAVNLALALSAEGARVGILDADIYGPSVPVMLGIPGFKPVAIDGKLMTAASVYGICAQSIGFLVSADEAAVWRGPMAAGALGQLLSETAWPELDYLMVDMPPGTGDIQLTLSQKVPLSGAVVVTTPQDIALADARKGISMFQKVNVPVLGIVENMSYHLCPKCGHEEHPFGSHGGSKMAERYHVPLLGELPLHINIREAMDRGAPMVVAEPESSVAAAYGEIARKMAAQLALQHGRANVSISISDDE
jgi:ATP-binding protein involved in chromosome partitioning